MAKPDFTAAPTLATDAELMAKNINQAAMIIEEIANTAERIDQICFYGVQPHDEFAMDKYEIQTRIIRDMVRRIGWMADTAADKLDGSQVHGDAEQWLVHPVYAANKTLEQSK